MDRRDDRLRQWLGQLPRPWPFPEPERFPAIDGRRLATPPQWRAGNGAWGCFRSHLLILEKCLLEGIDSYVVFEDDAGFADDFPARLRRFVGELPDDWGMVYLGGQHLYAGKHPPQKITDHVYRPYNVNRTHAFMVRGRPAMKTLYRHLNWNEWQTKHHIDHHLGRLIQRRYELVVEGKHVEHESLAVYTPKTYEHWEFFYRASRIEGLAVAVATDCFVRHAHVQAKSYRGLRGRAHFRAMGLRKHGFHSMRYPGGTIVHA